MCGWLKALKAARLKKVESDERLVENVGDECEASDVLSDGREGGESDRSSVLRG